jgi:hypothetical protein
MPVWSPWLYRVPCAAQMTLIKDIRSRLKALEKERHRKKMEEEGGDEEEDVTTLDDEEQARVREEKIKRASQVKYNWVNFPHIRDGSVAGGGCVSGCVCVGVWL